MTISRRVFGSIALTLVVAACAPASSTTGGPSVSNAVNRNSYSKPDMLVETTALSTNLKKPNTLIVDTRTKEKYAAGHIPGAVWFDAATQLKDPDDKLYVPRPELFTKSMNAIGVTPETNIVAYDDGGELSPARMWWVLDYYGHTKAQIVNGGYVKWEKEKLPIETTAVTPATGSFTSKINPDTVCALDVVQQASTNTNDYIIVDARTAAEFLGTDVRATRGGHIPNSINVDWQRNITTDDLKTWKPAAELRDMYEKAGVKADKKIITYCQTAVRASHVLFTLRLLGYGQVSNYDGSWAEYGNRTDTPIAK